MNKGPDIRIGTISTVDYQRGMASVIYNDLNGAVTADMPILNFNGEYKMPKADDTVAVLYLSNGSSIGLIVGSFWNEGNKPPISGKDVFRKDIGPGAYIQYNEGELIIHAPKVTIVETEKDS